MLPGLAGLTRPCTAFTLCTLKDNVHLKQPLILSWSDLIHCEHLSQKQMNKIICVVYKWPQLHFLNCPANVAVMGNNWLDQVIIRCWKKSGSSFTVALKKRLTLDTMWRPDVLFRLIKWIILGLTTELNGCLIWTFRQVWVCTARRKHNTWRSTRAHSVTLWTWWCFTALWRSEYLCSASHEDLGLRFLLSLRLVWLNVKRV